jgi:membrane protein DedA with SNARE-associated domain
MDPVLCDIASSAQEVFQQFTYLGPFIVLLLCGMGLPLPEEVTLIGSGILVYQGKADFVLISATCSAAILLGDLIPYYLGHHFGKSVLKIPFVARILHPERFARLEKRFLDHGMWATFVCRFLPGVRIPGYFVSGTMGMRSWRFLLIDGLGILISVPISIHIGFLFGDQMDRLKATMKDLHLVLGFLVVALVIILVVKTRKNRLAARALANAAAVGPPAPRKDPMTRPVDDPGQPE